MPRHVSLLTGPAYLQPLLAQVADRTGYPIRLREGEAIGYDSELRIVRPGQATHEVAYVPSFREYRLHFLVSGAYKLLRTLSTDAGPPLLPVGAFDQLLPQADHAELQRKLPDMPAEDLDTLSRFLRQGITRQLTSMPMDIRVEREIAEQLPEHREMQQAYLRRQVADLEPTFSPELARVSPERAYLASTAMNVVLAEEAAELTGTPPGPACKRSVARPTGECLRTMLHELTVPGYEGDRLLTDQWAYELGLRELYEWAPARSLG